MVPDYEELQESEAAEIYVHRFQKQEVFAKESVEFLCASGTHKLPGRPRPSKTAKGNLEREYPRTRQKREAPLKVRGPCVKILSIDIMKNLD